MKRKKTVGICGNFAGNSIAYDGQRTKTRNIAHFMKNHFGDNEVATVDLDGWQRHPIAMLCRCIKIVKNSKNVIVLLGENGISLMLPLFCMTKSLYRHKLYYCVVGGWLADLLYKKKRLLRFAKKLDGIFVETNSLKGHLVALGLSKIYYSPVFSTRTPVSMTDLMEIVVSGSKDVYRFCTFSRVVKEKGITEAIDAISKVNSLTQHGPRCILDIYGKLGDSYKEELDYLLKKHSDCIRYLGSISDDEVINTLKKYDAMLFPTYYPGEGFPASILESFMAGVPVIASDWKYNSEIVTDKKTGLIFSLSDKENLVMSIRWCLANTDALHGMKINCINEAKNYTAEISLKPLMDLLPPNSAE